MSAVVVAPLNSFATNVSGSLPSQDAFQQPKPSLLQTLGGRSLRDAQITCLGACHEKKWTLKSQYQDPRWLSDWLSSHFGQ